MRIGPDEYLNRDDGESLGFSLRAPLDRIHGVVVLPCAIGAILLAIGWHMPGWAWIVFLVSLVVEVAVLGAEPALRFVEWRQRCRLADGSGRRQLDADSEDQ